MLKKQLTRPQNNTSTRIGKIKAQLVEVEVLHTETPGSRQCSVEEAVGCHEE
jgi:hypothetical protein